VGLGSYYRTVWARASRDTVAFLKSQILVGLVVAVVTALVTGRVSADVGEAFNVRVAVYAAVVAAAAIALVALVWNLVTVPWRLHEEQTMRATTLTGQVSDLEAGPAPKLVFVREACCQRNASLGQVGVANPHSVTVKDARVSITIPALQLDDVPLKWAGKAAGEGFDIHPAPLSRHPHTEYFLSVGDSPGRYFFHPADGPFLPIEAGHYGAELCVKGHNIAATTAKIVFAVTDRSLTLTLM
jgi:hypothetical protein